ncbi:Scramblase, partial [Basidiobolus meristosporus CBS 931.73]
GTLDMANPAARLLEHGTVVVTRQLEMLNIFMGFEQANKYAIADQYGNYLGFLAEEDTFGNTLARQLLRTHRKFNATVLDKEGNVILKIHRPFSWINSRIFIYRSDDTLIGEVQQEWHLWRRTYNLFIKERQFARIDSGFLSWEFLLQNEQGGMLGHVTRNFGGFAREIFTDTGTYMLKMDDVEDNARALTLDERAVTLAAAVTIDFDYFSRHSRHG